MQAPSGPPCFCSRRTPHGRRSRREEAARRRATPSPERAAGRGRVAPSRGSTKGKPVFFKADNIEFFSQGKGAGLQAGRLVEALEDGHRVRSAAHSTRRLRKGPWAPSAARGTRRVRQVSHDGQEDGSERVYPLRRPLTDAGVKNLVRSKAAGVAQGGRELWTDAAGQPVKYEITIRLKGKRGNAEVDGSTTRTVTSALSAPPRWTSPKRRQRR